MRVLVCGGRNYRDADRFGVVMNKLHDSIGISLIIQGGAKGADDLAYAWAHLNGVEQQQFDADWENLGSFAGPARNKRMIEEGRPDFVVAFPGGRGTADMVKKARKAGVEVYEIAEA